MEKGKIVFVLIYLFMIYLGAVVGKTLANITF